MRQFTTIITLALALFIALLTSAHAAGTPQLIITWKANNYYPINFEGRALPSPTTPVTVSVEGTVDGKLIDLSKTDISWYKDGDRFDIGTGLKETSFNAEDTDAGSHFIRVAATINGAPAEQTVRIPVVTPVAVLEVPYPDKTVPAGSVANLVSVPYFFNAASITDFIFSWQIGDLKQNTGSDNLLAVNVGTPYTDDQRTVTVNSYIQNRNNPFEIVKLLTEIFVK